MDTTEDTAGLSPFITRGELRRVLPYSPQYIARLETQGKFPKRIQTATHKVVWRRSEVLEWIEQRHIDSARRSRSITSFLISVRNWGKKTLLAIVSFFASKTASKKLENENN